MEKINVKLVRFLDFETLETFEILESNEKIYQFLESYKSIDVSNIFELNDSVFSFEEISIKYERNSIELWIYSRFLDLIKNIPNG
jgi:hypothetical protein